MFTIADSTLKIPWGHGCDIHTAELTPARSSLIICVLTVAGGATAAGRQSWHSGRGLPMCFSVVGHVGYLSLPRKPRLHFVASRVVPSWPYECQYANYHQFMFTQHVFACIPKYATLFPDKPVGIPDGASHTASLPRKHTARRTERQLCNTPSQGAPEPERRCGPALMSYSITCSLLHAFTSRPTIGTPHLKTSSPLHSSSRSPHHIPRIHPLTCMRTPRGTLIYTTPPHTPALAPNIITLDRPQYHNPRSPQIS